MFSHWRGESYIAMQKSLNLECSVREIKLILVIEKESNGCILINHWSFCYYVIEEGDYTYSLHRVCGQVTHQSDGPLQDEM